MEILFHKMVFTKFYKNAWRACRVPKSSTKLSLKKLKSSTTESEITFFEKIGDFFWIFQKLDPAKIPIQKKAGELLVGAIDGFLAVGNVQKEILLVMILIELTHRRHGLGNDIVDEEEKCVLWS